MRQYRFPALAALALTLALAGLAVLLWTQTASAHLPQRLTSSGPALTTGQHPARIDSGTSAAPPAGIEGAVTATPTATAACGPGNYRVLIVYADSSGPPSALQTQILAEPGVSQVDLFDAVAGTPTLAQLQPYNIVAPLSNNPFLDATTLGNNLADYVDGGGIVVQLGFSFYGPNQAYGVNGRWVTGNYNPYTYSTNLSATAFTLGTFNAGHPLMQGVTALNSNYQNIVTPAGGGTQVAAASNGNSLVAYRPVGTHTTVGITAYIGIVATQSGDWGKVIVNAGRWLIPGGSCGTATATTTRTVTVVPGTPSPTPTCAAASGTPGPWVTVSPYPMTITRYGFAQVADSFYVLGGVSNGTRVPNTYRYDVGPGTWTALANIPVASEAPAAAYWNGKIYLAEGDTGSSFRIYDIATNTWTTGPNVPGAANRYGAAAGAFNNKVYVIGGTASFQSDVQIYDIATNTWAAGTAAPNGFLLAGYQTVGQYLYLVGGFGSSGPSAAAGSSVLSRTRVAAPAANNTSTLRLDMTTGTWATGPTFTPNRADFALAYSAGKLYAIGGDTTGGGYFDSSTAVDELAVAGWPAGSWTTSPPVLPTPIRQGNQAGFASSDGRIWSVGGLNGATFQFLNEVDARALGGSPCPTATQAVTPTRTVTVVPGTPSPTPTCGTGGGSPGAWTVRTPYPFTHYGAGVVSDGTYVYVSGGNTIGGSVHAELYRYDVATDTYTALASAPTAHYLSTVVYGGNGKIYDIAGLNPTVGSNLNRIYDIASNTWSTGAVLPTSLYDAAGAYYNGKIYVMGGTTGAAINNLYIYDVATNVWSSGASLPVAEFAMAAGVIGSKIYIAGGSTGSGQVNTLYIYDIPTNAWSSGATMATAANYPAGAVIGGKFWAIGGGNPFLQATRPSERPALPANGPLSNAPASFNNTQIYDPATNTWTAGPTLSQPRSFFNAATVGNTVVVVGGYNSSTAASINVTEINVTTGGGCPTPSATAPVGTPSPTPTCAATGGTPGPWVVQSPAPTDFYGGAATTDGVYAYVAGAYSFSSGQTTAQFIRYNPATNAWATLSPMPQAAMETSAVYAPNVNKIFVFGGQDAVSGVSYNITRIYDLVAGTWSTGLTMPDVRAFMASGYYNGKIYLIGGYTNGQVTSSQAQVWEYDPVANTFATRAPMTQPLGGAASAVVNGHLYVIGGRDGTIVARNQVYDYDITANAWATRTNLPVGTNVPGGAVIGGKIWIFGGGNPFLAGAGVVGGSGKATDAPATTGITQIYDPVTDSWSTGPNLNQIRSFAAGTGVGNYAVAVGGYTGSTTTSSTEVSLSAGAPCGTPTATVVTTPTRTATGTMTPAASPTCTSSSAWRIEPPLPSARAYAAGAVVNNQFYVISGFSGSAPDPAVARFDPATNVWTTLSPIPTPISQARGAALGTKIYVAGGFNNGFGGQTTGMQIYDTATGLWSQGAPLPEARAGAGVAAANGKIYIIAGFGPGFSTRNTVYEYDPTTNTYATRAAAPASEGNIAVGVLGSLIYAVGGSGTFMHYAYDPVANTWATIAAGPTANHQTPGVFALAGELWVMGGSNGFSPYPPNQQVQIYNPVSDAWRFGPVFNVPRYGASAAGTINGRGYVAAGVDGTSGAYLSSMESIAPAGVCGTPTPTATIPPTPTTTLTATATLPPTNTVTATGTPTDTPPPTATPRPASATPTNAPPTAVPTMTACPIYFQDVPVNDPFFTFVRCLTCRALLSGYPCGSPGEPCVAPGNQPYFRPNNDATRSQIAKILSNAAGYNNAIPSTQQTFEDVLPGSTFWVFIERIADRGFITGYPCGGPLEPCVAPGNRPYFRPYASVTRGQLSKMDALTAGFTETPTGQTFEDILPGSTFYLYIERLATRGVIAGYPCGGVGEPCIAPGNRSYFRVFSYVTRAQTAKIIANSFFPNCQTPVRRP